MWQRPDFLVPSLNGTPYSHKPPLLFWLIHLGWWIFGVNEWWPRLVPALFALACLFLTARIGRILWPDSSKLPLTIPHLLLAIIFWSFYATLVMFDILVTFFTIISLLGLFHVTWGRSIRGWLLTSLGLGLGLLSKGPVIFVSVLPVALLAPWWAKNKKTCRWPNWYAGVLTAILLSVIIGLLWAVPAARSGGEAYAHAILWGQTAGRIIHSFAHPRPWWWYLPWLPLLLLPWSLCRALWRSLIRLDFRESGNRFCLAWIIPPLLVFSLLSGKQPHYLLPLIPAFALLFGRLLEEETILRRDHIPYALFLFFLGISWLLIPGLAKSINLPQWMSGFNPLIGFLMIIFGIILVLFPFREPFKNAIVYSGISIMILIILHIGVLKTAAPYYDCRPLANILHKFQEEGLPIAHIGDYDGQYQFLGRLKKPLQVIPRNGLTDWLKTHPQGRAILYVKNWPVSLKARVEYVHPFRGKFAVIVTKAAKNKTQP